MKKRYILPLLVLFAACMSDNKEQKQSTDTLDVSHTIKDSIILPQTQIDTAISRNISVPKTISPQDSNKKQKTKPITQEKEAISLEKSLTEMGLVDIQSLDASIKVDVKYTTTDNFMKADAYGDLDKIFLQKEVAEMLVKAHTALKKSYPNYRFIVFDGARPFRVQQKMWQIVKGTDMAHYVARPDAKGSMHNYGCAVDLSIIDEKGKELDMGTPFDFLGALAQTTIEEAYIKQGKLTRKQVDNRLILRKAMESVDFTVLKREWWHFNAFSDDVVLKKYKKIP